MAVVHRFILPEASLRPLRRDRTSEAEIVILPCVRRERPRDWSAGAGLSLERAGFVPAPALLDETLA